MKKIKAMICITLALLMLAGSLTGCNDKKNETEATGYTEYVTPDDYATTDEVRIKDTFKGSGKNSKLEPSLSLYGKTYTLGKSTVADMLNDGWQKDEENWIKFPPEKKIPAHSVNIIAKSMFKGENENKRKLFISFRNITDSPCTTDNCVLSKIEVDGRYDTFLGEAKASFFGGKLDFTKCVDAKSFEAELSKLVSKATRAVEGYFYSTYNKYSFKVQNGNAYIIVRTDTDTGKLRNISASITLSSTYSAK